MEELAILVILLEDMLTRVEVTVSVVTQRQTENCLLFGLPSKHPCTSKEL